MSRTPKNRPMRRAVGVSCATGKPSKRAVGPAATNGARPSAMRPMPMAEITRRNRVDMRVTSHACSDRPVTARANRVTDVYDQAMQVLYLHGFASGPSSRKAVAFSEHYGKRGITIQRLDLRVPSF